MLLESCSTSVTEVEEALYNVKVSRPALRSSNLIFHRILLSYICEITLYSLHFPKLGLGYTSKLPTS